MSLSTDKRRSRRLSAPLSLALSCVSSCAFAQRAELIVRPVEPHRPAALTGRWCGPSLCLSLGAEGRAQVSELLKGTSGQVEERVLERGLWWVEGRSLCLTAGLELACEPYQGEPASGVITLKGVTLSRAEPKGP